MLHIEKTTIHAGLAQPVKLLHVTDSHLVYADERDDYRKRLLAQERLITFHDENGGIERNLVEMIEYAEANCDLLVHTGDLYDFITHANIERSARFLAHPNFFFIVGNHEYSQYIGEAWEDNTYKMNAYMRIRKGLGVDTFYASRQIGGLNIVGLDNTYYQFEDWYLDRLRKEAEKGMPILLMMHIPVFEESLYSHIMDVRKESCAGLVGCDEERLMRYEEIQAIRMRPNDATKRLLEYIAGEKAIVALIAGHVHFSFESRLPCGKMQYVTGGGFDGIAREITID